MVWCCRWRGEEGQERKGDQREGNIEIRMEDELALCQLLERRRLVDLDALDLYWYSLSTPD